MLLLLLLFGGCRRACFVRRRRVCMCVLVFVVVLVVVVAALRAFDLKRVISQRLAAVVGDNNLRTCECMIVFFEREK